MAFMPRSSCGKNIFSYYQDILRSFCFSLRITHYLNINIRILSLPKTPQEKKTLKQAINNYIYELEKEIYINRPIRPAPCYSGLDHLAENGFSDKNSPSQFPAFSGIEYFLIQ